MLRELTSSGSFASRCQPCQKSQLVLKKCPVACFRREATEGQPCIRNWIKSASLCGEPFFQVSLYCTLHQTSLHAPVPNLERSNRTWNLARNADNKWLVTNIGLVPRPRPSRRVQVIKLSRAIISANLSSVALKTSFRMHPTILVEITLLTCHTEARSQSEESKRSNAGPW